MAEKPGAVPLALAAAAGLLGLSAVAVSRRSSLGSADYPYGPSRTGRYVLKRDGRVLKRGTEGELWDYLHARIGYSISHALRYEGYSIEPED